MKPYLQNFTPAFQNFILGQESKLGHNNKRSRLTMSSHRIFEILRQAIIQLELRPGITLSEAETAQQFGVSRQPVREAFIKLSEVGLLEILPQRGTLVRLISIREVNNARFLREAVETAIVQKAAKEATEEDITSLKANLDAHRHLSDDKDYVGFYCLDEAFHQAIAKSADCEDAWRTLDPLKAQMDRVRFLALPDATPISIILEQHEKIVQSMEEKNSDAAAAAMRKHLHEIQTSLPKLAKKYPELFSD